MKRKKTKTISPSKYPWTRSLNSPTRSHHNNGLKCNAAFSFNMPTVLQEGSCIQYAYIPCTRKKGQKTNWRNTWVAPVIFNHDKLILIFNKSVLDLPIVTGNKEMLAIFEDYMNEIQMHESGQNNSLSRTVRRYLMHSLSNSSLSLKDVAEKFNMSERNIQRKLKAEGTSYQKILNDLRMELSKKKYLKERIPLPEIGFLLGFESQSAFNKFFKKHFRNRPSMFNSNNQSVKTEME